MDIGCHRACRRRRLDRNRLRDFGQFGLLAFAGSSLAFGVMHQRWLAAALAGAIYALLIYRTKRLSDPIAAPAVTNLTIIVWPVAARQWSLL